VTADELPPLEEPPFEPDFDYTPPPPPDTPRGAPTRLPPQDQAAEQAILGAAMIDPAVIDKLTGIITAADFYNPHHETIWRTITHLHASGHPTDPIAVAGHLRNTNQLIKTGGAPYLHTLLTVAPQAVGDATYHAHTVDQLARQRAAIARFERGLQRLQQPGASIDDILNAATNELLEARDQLGNPPAPTTWTPVDLEPVLAGEHLDPPPTMLARTDGVYLFYDGAVHTVSGESESGKTWLCLIAALQLIQEDQRVVFLDFEDRADRVIGRLLALGATLPQIRANFAYIRPDRPLDDDGRTQLAPALHNTRLVILDGVTEAMTMHGYDLNSNADSALFQGILPRWLADHGPAVVMIDHVVKDKEKQDRFALGAQHKLAGIDGVAYIVKMLQPFARGRRGLARVDIAKDRPGHVREYAHGRSIAEFTLDATASDLILLAHLLPPGADSGRTGDTFEPTYLMEKISRYVEVNPSMSKKAIEGAMNGKATTIRLALELLVSRQYIGVKTGARGAVQHFHIKPFRQDPDDENDPDIALTDTAQEAS
jgi:DnaB helicase-like protein/AAA domain-containing protein